MPLDKEQRTYLLGRLNNIYQAKIQQITSSDPIKDSEMKALIKESGLRLITPKEFEQYVIEAQGHIGSYAASYVRNSAEFDVLRNKRNNERATQQAAAKSKLSALHTKLKDQIILGDSVKDVAAILAELEAFKV